MPVTDPRYLDATPDDMLLDYYAEHYQRMRRLGKNVEVVEDDNFDVSQILSDLEDNDGEPSVPDDWEDADTWEADDF